MSETVVTCAKALALGTVDTKVQGETLSDPISWYLEETSKLLFKLNRMADCNIEVSNEVRKETLEIMKNTYAALYSGPQAFDFNLIVFELRILRNILKSRPRTM